MRVLVVSRHYLRPGMITGAHVHRQCAELKRIGVDVEVICPVPRFSSGTPTRAGVRKVIARMQSVSLDGVPITYVPYANVPHRVSVDLDTRSLRNAITAALPVTAHQGRFDLVHAHRLFPDAWAALPIARTLDCRFVATAHGSDVHTNPLRNAGIARCTRRLISGSDRILAVSQALARQLRTLEQPRHDVGVVYHGVDTDRFRPNYDKIAMRRRLGLPVHGVGVCTVSRLAVEKGLRELLAAFETLVVAPSDTWLLLVGDGPARRELEERCRQVGLEEKVFFAGARPNREVGDWLNASDIFTLPSYKEGLPNVVLEAMACGLPIVATDVGGIVEAVSAECGYVVPPRDVPSLRSALDRLRGSAELRGRLGGAGLHRIQESFSWQQSALGLREVYEELTGPRRHVGPGTDTEASRERGPKQILGRS